jgi:transcriptional regulator with XRE-family HTH domain
MSMMIGERLRGARHAQGLSLAEVAGKVKVSVATLSRIETSKQAVDLDLFLNLAEALDVPARELLTPEKEAADGIDPLARRIAALGSSDRTELWRELASERRTRPVGGRAGGSDQVAQQVEELLAQIDFLRQELEAMRTRIRKR